jgi:hypothetical protein
MMTGPNSIAKVFKLVASLWRIQIDPTGNTK